MTETVSRSASADGWNEPTKNLPPLELREMPEPLPLRKLIGASVILLATALGSGELLIWPYITTQAGVGLLWLAAIGFLSQYFLNMEIERYTLATGETAVTGFSRFWKPWGSYLSLARSCRTPSPAGQRAQPRRSPTSSVSAILPFPGSSRYCSSPSASLLPSPLSSTTPSRGSRWCSSSSSLPFCCWR